MTAFRPRILVIDDEPQIHRFLGPALDAAGYEPIRADDATSGPVSYTHLTLPTILRV